MKDIVIGAYDHPNLDFFTVGTIINRVYGIEIIPIIWRMEFMFLRNRIYDNFDTDEMLIIWSKP